VARLFFNSTPTTPFPTNKVYFVELYRTDGSLKWYVDGIKKGDDRLFNNNVYIDSFGSKWGGTTSVPYQSGYMYDLSIGNVGDIELFTLDNPFSDYPSNIYGSKGTRLTGYNFVASQIEEVEV
jgi:hypothetical protein